MWALMIPALVIGGLILFGKGKNGNGIVPGGPWYPKAGEVWAIGFRTSAPMTRADWEQLLAAWPGDIMGVTAGAGANEYQLIGRFGGDATLPVSGSTIRSNGTSATLLYAQPQPVF